jgi:hypothetical protein
MKSNPQQIKYRMIKLKKKKSIAQKHIKLKNRN